MAWPKGKPRRAPEAAEPRGEGAERTADVVHFVAPSSPEAPRADAITASLQAAFRDFSSADRHEAAAALAVLSHRLDEVKNALPAALAVASGDLRDRLTALRDLL